MNKLLHFALCSILLTSTVLVSAQEPTTDVEASSVKGVRRALLVAVSKYAKGFTELPSVDNDVKLMKDELLNSGFKEQYIRVLQYSGTMPTRDNIKDAVQELAASCGSEDLAFIMLTGHGLRNEKTRKDFFLPLDAKASDFNTFVPLDFVIDALESSKAKFKWILVDACRSAGKGANDGNGVGKLTPKPGMLIFQSSSPGEVSYFTDDEQYGLFVYNFVEGLRGGAIDDYGRVSVLGAFAYARNKIESRQHPVMSSQDFDDFVLSVNENWTHAANFYHKAVAAFDAKDFIQAQKDIQFALAFDTPLHDFYQKKAETFKILAETAKKIEEEAKKSASNVNGTEGLQIANAAPRNSSPNWDTVQAGDGRFLTINGVETVFRYCPSGTFMMGSPESEEGRVASWETQHKVELTQDFWLMETETTQKLWQAVTGENPSYFKGDNLPVDSITWDDCQRFVDKLNALQVAPNGFEFSLPTEAQWEYACRAGSTTPFPWGAVLNGEQENCKGDEPYGTDVKGKFLNQPVAVKSYAPNAWKLYDMCGNVCEWCKDYVAAYPNANRVDPCVENIVETQQKWGAWRVVRGGTYKYEAGRCRVAIRSGDAPENRASCLGCRLALVRRPVKIETVGVGAAPASSGGTTLDVDLNGEGGGVEQNPASTDWETGKAGDRRVIMVDGIEFAFRYCPAGRHTIGSPESEEGREDDETQHDVIFSHPYWMMETEVTQEMWQKVMGDNPSSFTGSNLPVECVSWNDCQDFISKLNEKGLAPSGWIFSLPTEAEWEVAARAGSGTAFPWGDSWDSTKANCFNLDGTVKVGSYPANAWGLYDTVGNVSEWCLDQYGDYPKTVETDYVGKEGLWRGLRGGSWFNDALHCRSAYRYNDDASNRYDDQGFRCVLAFALVRQQQQQ